jgi:CRISPR-associated protein Csm1
MDQKEYQSLILGALLHDIGKFMNRAGKIRRKHPLFSGDFVSSEDFKKIVSEDWVDIELVQTLVQRHHEYEPMGDDLLVQEIEHDRVRALAYIVSRADNYSSRERMDEEPSGSDFRTTRLMSIFSEIDIGKKKQFRKEDYARYYDLKPLSPKGIFPQAKDHLAWATYDYKKHIDRFGMAMERFKPKDFSCLFSGLLSIMEKYLWCVPSDTTEEYNDIPLFDHLSTTSAIAACLYQYHEEDLLDEEAIKNDNVDKFLLVGGDLSGIQTFIFEIGARNPKRLSKTLRGRSFYLSLLCDVMSLRLLMSLNLPLSCRIMHAGGRFVILAPNTEKAKESLNLSKGTIEHWFFETFLGKLTLNLCFETTIAGKDFEPERFRLKNRELGRALEVAKNKKFPRMIKEGDEGLRPYLGKAYDRLQKAGGVCEFCKVYPKVGGERCQICEDAAIIGQKLPTSTYLYFLEAGAQADLKVFDIGLNFSKKSNEPVEWFFLEKIGKDQDDVNRGWFERMVVTYLPETKKGDIDFDHEKPREGDTLCRWCGNPCKLEGEELKGDERGKIEARKELVSRFLTFQCLSASSPRRNRAGVDHLAVVKADIDDLGVIFSQGLKGRFSISRYATLSRMLDYFFTCWLSHRIEEGSRFTYSIYAGGDDLLLIAPWEEALHLGRDIAAGFNTYVCENPNIAISMGINLVRPGSPVGLATYQADVLLDKSKEREGKASLTVFSTTAGWDLLEKLEEFKSFLDTEFKNEKSGVNASFLYRVLAYQRMFFSAKDKGKIEDYIFHSRFARDVRRNIETREGGEKVARRLEPLYVVGNVDEELMRHLKLPIFWVLYRNRRLT